MPQSQERAVSRFLHLHSHPYIICLLILNPLITPHTNTQAQERAVSRFFHLNSPFSSKYYLPPHPCTHPHSHPRLDTHLILTFSSHTSCLELRRGCTTGFFILISIDVHPRPHFPPFMSASSHYPHLCLPPHIFPHSIQFIGSCCG